MDYILFSNRNIKKFTEEISELGMLEPYYVKMSGEFSFEQQLFYYQKCLEKSHLTYPVFHVNEIFNQNSRWLLEKLDFKGICIEFDLELEEQKWSTEVLRTLSATARSKSAQRLNEICDIYSSRYQISIVIHLQQNSLEHLRPLMALAFEKGVNTVLLDPKKIDAKTYGPIVRETFRALEIFSERRSFVVFIGNYQDQWDAITLNKFSGPKIVALDVSNSCNHNCTFCGLYAPELESSRHINELKSKKLNPELCHKILDGLSPIAELVQFGGAGDPFTNKSIVDFIVKVIDKGIMTEVLTNFSYMTPEIIDTLHSKTKLTKDSLIFIVNISGATAETYIKTRPNQKPKDFQRIIDHLEYACHLHHRDNGGMKITLMCVTCKTNYHEIPAMVKLAAKLKVHDFWIKPMEIHGEHTLKLVIHEDLQQDYCQKLQEALQLADELNVSIYDRSIVEKVIQDYLESQEIQDSNQEVQESSEHFTKVQNGCTAREYFNSHPCRIANIYVRVNVDGKVQPCCMMNPLGVKNVQSLADIWYSGSMEAFRNKMERIHVEKFHLHDPEWIVCQQCPHLLTLNRYNKHFE